VLIELPNFDNLTGRQMSRPFVQKYDPAAWKQFQETGPRMGWWVRRLLHAPAGIDTGYTNPDPNIKRANTIDGLQAQMRALQQQIEALSRGK